MAELREPTLMVVIGFKGVGKTYTTNKEIDAYIKNDPSGWKGRPVLVFDVNNEYCDSNGYYGYKAIDFDVTEQNAFKRSEQIRKITVPAKYRIIPYKKNGQPMTSNELMITASTVVSYFRNGMLLLEDINKYALSNFKQDFVGMFVGLRHLGVDLVVHFQSLRAIPPKIWSEMGFLRWHKQSENILKYRGRISNLELFSIAEAIVNHKFQSDAHYYLWIDVMREKLINVTKEDFAEGCNEYLSFSTNKWEIRDMMNKTDLNAGGGRVYKTERDAILGFIEKKSKQYLPSSS
jgi:hypothetical protein